MAEAGILTEDDRIELIGGEILAISPIGSRHNGCVLWLQEEFSERLSKRAHAMSQGPIELDEYSEPQPDVVLLRRRADFYRRAHAVPPDILLAVEVADSSVDYDRHVKIPRYAAAQIPEVWLVDLPAERVEVHRDPAPDGYRDVQSFGRSERISPVAFPDLVLAVDDILG
jgi:Uma2 family endonuclease